VEPRQRRSLKNRDEYSHRPTRQRERRMQGLKSAGHAQRVLSAYGPMVQHFRPRRHLLSASEYRAEMRNRFESWAAITGSKRAAEALGRWQSRPESAFCCVGTRSSPTT
jgi:putative transposase